MNQELQDYIKKSREAGFNDEQIKQELLKVDWKEVDIEEGFKLFTAENKQETTFITPKGKSSKKLVIVIIAIFILLAGGAFGFYYYNKIKTQQSPKDSFLEFKSALENAKTYEEVVGLAKQYMSKTTDTEALGYEQINLSAEQKKQLLALFKTTPPLTKDIVDISEEINGATGRLIIKTKDNKLCGLPLFLEDNQWKFGIMECKEAVVAQPPANAITSCGSIKFMNVMNADIRTATETDALNCMVQALTNCESKALTITGVQAITYKIESKEDQYCNISREAGLRSVCKVPFTFISKKRQQYKTPIADDIFLSSIIMSIDGGGKYTDGITGETKSDFVCQ